MSPWDSKKERQDPCLQATSSGGVSSVQSSIVRTATLGCSTELESRRRGPYRGSFNKIGTLLTMLKFIFFSDNFSL